MEILAFLALDKIVESVFHHPVGERVFDKIETTVKNYGADKKLPPNHDLLKVMRIAMLRSTVYMGSAITNELSILDDKAAGDFKGNIEKWYYEESKRAEHTARSGAFKTQSYDEIELWLTEQKNEDIEKVKQALARKTKEEWEDEVRAGFAGMDAPLPDLFHRYLMDGWTDEKGILRDWFNIACYWFGQLLKKKEYEPARIAFQHRMLSEINTDVGIVLDALSTIGGDTDYLRERWDAMEKQWQRIEDKQDDMLTKQDQIMSSQGDLTSILKNMERQIMEMQAARQNVYNPELENRINILIAEKEELRQQLQQNKEIIEQQEATRKELEKSLAAEQEKETLKKKALEAVEQKDYDTAENLLMEAAGERIQKVAEDFYQLAKVKELKLEYAAALEYYELAAKISPSNSEYLTAAGKLCMTFGLLSKALDYHERSLAINQKTLGELHKNTARDYNELGLIWKNKGYLDKAIEYLDKALKIGLGLFGEHNPNVAIRYNNLGSAWQDKGDLDKAIEYLDKALKIDLGLFGETNPNTAIDYNNLGLAWKGKGDLDKAIEYYEKALKIDLSLFGETNPNTAIDYNNLGLAWQDKGDLGKAIEYLNKALKINLGLFGALNPNVATLYNNLGSAWQDKGGLDKAIGYLDKALKIDLGLFGETNPNTAIDYNNLGLAWQDKGNIVEAKRLVQKSYHIFLQLYGPDNPSTRTAKENLDRLSEA